MSTISVIIPSFNQGRYIERTIVSVLSQQDVTLELVVVDGGSSDETLDILTRYESGLRWISEKDSGQADAVNKGILSSHGDIIGWLNSDDIYCPDALSRVCGFFERHADVDVLYGDAWIMDADDHITGKYATEAWDVGRLCDICYLCQPAVFFRRSAIERYGLLDEKLIYCMDYEFWLRLALAGCRFACLPQVLAGSRTHPETKTVARRIAAHQEILTMLKQKLGRAPDRWVAGYARVMAEEKGLGPDHNPLGFVGMVLFVSVKTAMRFNRAVSWGLVRITVRWLMTGMRLMYYNGTARK